MLKICQEKGEVRKFECAYSAFKASRNLKERDNGIKVTEFIYLIKTKTNE